MSWFRLKPWRSQKHLDRVRRMPCCACGDPAPNEAHHIIGVGDGRIGSKAPDSQAIPLCHECHRDLHENGSGVAEQWRWLALTLADIVEGRV